MLQRLTQGSKMVNEYFKEMEVSMITSYVEKDMKSSMAQFLSGLNQEIATMVNLYHYIQMEDMVQIAIMVERKLKRKNNQSLQKLSLSLLWRLNWRREDETTSKHKIEPTKTKKVVQ